MIRSSKVEYSSGATSATCTPSRYSLLTGEYAWRQKGTSILRGDAALKATVIVLPAKLPNPVAAVIRLERTSPTGKQP
jgi:hypothetical protein